MLMVCFAILSMTVGLGAVLVAGRRGWLAMIHGVSGAAGLAVLALAFRRGLLNGKLALDVLVLLAAGFCGGLLMASYGWRRRRPPGLVLLLHAFAGGVAYLMLFGFAFG
jgi:hypothetical protein